MRLHAQTYSLHTVVIGNGISGITCARHLRKRSKEEITVISSETDHFFSRTALMYIYMGHMTYEHTKPYEDYFWVKNRIALVRGRVERIQFEEKLLHFNDGSFLTYDRLVLATGGKPRKLDWPGQDLPGVQGLYSMQDLELLEQNTHAPFSKQKRVRNAVIVGGGLIGVELAEMLCTRDIHVTMLVREDRFWGNVLSREEAELVHRALHLHGVKLILNDELVQIEAGADGRVGSILTKEGRRLSCEFVGLTVGVEPNVDFLRNTELELARGIKVDCSFRTNIKDVFAIGDCAEFSDPPQGVKALNQVWYTGRIMGETLAQVLAGDEVDYCPGPWFNSAKFFNLEYQTYGEVIPIEKPGISSFVWRESSAQRLIKVSFHPNDFKILGISSLGIRIRHDKFDQMLSSGAVVMEVFKNWDLLVFDPEFTSNFCRELCSAWNKSFPEQRIEIAKKKSWF